jgi:hypothetical protein
MLSKRKMVEIRPWEFEWDPPCRVRRRYSHVVLRVVKPLRLGAGRTNIMAALGRTLGPFGDARAAYEATRADLAELKLGLTVYMTRERKILNGPRKGGLETRIVPVAPFELLDVHEIRRGVAWRGAVRRGVARRGAARRGGAGRGGAGRGAAWRGVAWRGAAWRGVAWSGVA